MDNEINNNENSEANTTKKDDKWEFEDYAFTITGIIVGVLLVVPELIYSFFDISILGGSFENVGADLGENLAHGFIHTTWSFNELRALSPMLFLLTTTIVFIKDAVDARTSGGYTGSLFRHTFESLLEDSIYMAITTIMVYGAILSGGMYASWLAGPITWILFLMVFPIFRKKQDNHDEVEKPLALLAIFALGIIVEIFTRQWIAFPASWLIICAIKMIQTIKIKEQTIDTVFDILYYSFSVVLLALGITLGWWITSWLAFPIAIFICWLLSKTKRFKRNEKVT